MGERAERFRVEALAVNPGAWVLVDEACRLIDALDRFEALISGDLNEWLSIDWPYEEGPARLVIGSLVAERRQTVAELRQVVRVIGSEKRAVPEAPAGEGGAPVLRLLDAPAGGKR